MTDLRYLIEIVWRESIRYLGVYFVSSKSVKCSLSNSKRSFYRPFNAIFGKVGRLAAAEPVTVELLKSKCLPSLYYGRSVPSVVGRLQVFGICSCRRIHTNIQY